MGSERPGAANGADPAKRRPIGAYSRGALANDGFGVDTFHVGARDPIDQFVQAGPTLVAHLR